RVAGPKRRRRDDQQHRARDQQQWPGTGFDIAQVAAVEGDLEQGGADEQQDHGVEPRFRCCRCPRLVGHHSSPPTTVAASTATTNRPTTIPGRPGNATLVATSTTGLIAGADSRNASAAAGGTPRRINAPATGTDPHSQPGSAAPARPATGTASSGRR